MQIAWCRNFNGVIQNVSEFDREKRAQVFDARCRDLASFPYHLAISEWRTRLSTRGWTDRATKSVKRRAIQLRRKARGGGSVLSGRRCFVTFVSSRSACRWRDNQSPPSLGKRKTKRRREKERNGGEGERERERARGPRVREKIESKAPRFPHVMYASCQFMPHVWRIRTMKSVTWVVLPNPQLFKTFKRTLKNCNKS